MPNEYEEVQEAIQARQAQIKAAREEQDVYGRPANLAGQVVSEGVIAQEQASGPLDDGETEPEVESQPEPVEATEEETATEAPEAPKESAKKEEWVAYRVQTHGLTEEAADEKTKQELIDLV